MSRTLKLADILAAVGAVAVLVSSFLNHEAHRSYIGWHELLVNQLVVTDILGFVAGALAVAASLGLLPRRVPWTALTAATSVVVLINSIVSALSFSQFLSQASALVHITSPGVGYAFYVAIAGGVVLVAGCSLRFVPVMVRPLAGGNKALTAASGYQAQGAYPGYAHQGVAPMAPTAYQPPAPAGYGAPGAYVPGPQGGYQPPAPAGYGTPAPAGYGTPVPAGYADPAPASPAAAQPGPAQPTGQFASPYQPAAPDAGGPPSGAWPAQSWPQPASQSQAPSPARPEPSATQAAPADSRDPGPATPGRNQAEAAPSPAPAWSRPEPVIPAPTPAPAPQPFSPFWAAVPTPRPVYQPDNSAGLAGTLHPGTWYAVVGTHPGGLLVQLPSGLNAVLVDTTDLIRA